MLDFAEPPDTYGVDECELLYKDPHTAFAYWEVTDGGLASARAQLSQSAASARLVLRLFTTSSGPNGLEREVKDVDLQWNHGRTYFHVPRPGSHLRVAVGLLSAEGYFAPIAHSSLHRLPPTGPASDAGPVEWMEVAPPRMRGKEPEPPAIARRGPGQTENEAEPAWRAGQYHHAGRRLSYRPVDVTEDRGSSPWRPAASPGKTTPEGKK